MDNQNDKANPQDIVTRDAAGRFLGGVSGNPSGTTKFKGYQPMSQRIVYLSEKYTPEEIVKFARDKEWRTKQLCYMDCLAVVHMARALDPALTRTDSGADQALKTFKELFDRVEGTSVQTIRTGALPPVDPGDVESLSTADKQRAYDQLMKS